MGRQGREGMGRGERKFPFLPFLQTPIFLFFIFLEKKIFQASTRFEHMTSASDTGTVIVESSWSQYQSCLPCYDPGSCPALLR